MYYKDTAGAMEDMDAKGKNEGFLERYEYCKENNTTEMMGRINHDMFQQEKLLLNKVYFTITLLRSASEFCLLSSTKKIVVFKRSHNFSEKQ